MPGDVITKIEQFFNQYRTQESLKGEILLMRGDSVKNIYYLRNGRVKQYDVTSKGDEIILNTFKPPAFFPMSRAINNLDSTYIFEAETDITVILAPAYDVIEFIKANPDVMFDLLSRVYRGVDGVMGRMSRLMSSGANERLRYELLQEGKRFGRLQKDGSCFLEINESDIGSRAGLSRETVSREVKKLKAEGLISMENNFIRLQDLSALENKTD
jgi:CRP-like cAMP-binding protein